MCKPASIVSKKGYRSRFYFVSRATWRRRWAFHPHIPESHKSGSINISCKVDHLSLDGENKSFRQMATEQQPARQRHRTAVLSQKKKKNTKRMNTSSYLDWMSETWKEELWRLWGRCGWRWLTGKINTKYLLLENMVPAQFISRALALTKQSN